MMVKKRVISTLLAVFFLAVLVVPATADKPLMWEEYYPPFDYPVTDCEPYGYDFWIWNSWEEWDRFHYKLNNDGSFNYLLLNADMIQTFTAVPDTGKSFSAETHDIGIEYDLEDNILEIRGSWQRIILPGVGPILHDAGRKVFYYFWNPDGTLTFDLISNSGPSTYTSNDFEALCAVLAP